jgi:hypothetical protein
MSEKGGFVWMQICVHAFLIGWRAAREDELENIR